MSWGGFNLKGLGDTLNKGLQDLEASLQQTVQLPGQSPSSSPSTARTQPARTSSSPAASPSSARQRPSLDLAGRAASALGAVQGPGSPLSPQALSQAQQSAGQLADSALSSLRASLRKGRQSLDSVTRASLDGGRSSLDGGARPATPEKGKRAVREGSILEEPEEVKEKEGKQKKKEEPLVDLLGLQDPPADQKKQKNPVDPSADALLVDFSEPERHLLDTHSPPPPPGAQLPTEEKIAPPPPAVVEEKAASVAAPSSEVSSVPPAADAPEEEEEDEDAWGVGDVEAEEEDLPAAEVAPVAVEQAETAVEQAETAVEQTETAVEQKAQEEQMQQAKVLEGKADEESPYAPGPDVQDTDVTTEAIPEQKAKLVETAAEETDRGEKKEEEAPSPAQSAVPSESTASADDLVPSTVDTAAPSLPTIEQPAPLAPSIAPAVELSPSSAAETVSPASPDADEKPEKGVPETASLPIEPAGEKEPEPEPQASQDNASDPADTSSAGSAPLVNAAASTTSDTPSPSTAPTAEPFNEEPSDTTASASGEALEPAEPSAAHTDTTPPSINSDEVEETEAGPPVTGVQAVQEEPLMLIIDPKEEEAPLVVEEAVAVESKEEQKQKQEEVKQEEVAGEEEVNQEELVQEEVKQEEVQQDEVEEDKEEEESGGIAAEPEEPVLLEDEEREEAPVATSSEILDSAADASANDPGLALDEAAPTAVGSTIAAAEPAPAVTELAPPVDLDPSTSSQTVEAETIITEDAVPAETPTEKDVGALSAGAEEPPLPAAPRQEKPVASGVEPVKEDSTPTLTEPNDAKKEEHVAPVPLAEEELAEPVPAEAAEQSSPAFGTPTASPRKRRGTDSGASAEISAAYKRLVALKSSLDNLVSDIFPTLSGVTNLEALGDELRNLKSRDELQKEEIKRITGQVEKQKERVGELRETHRLEHQSQQEEIDALRDSLGARNKALDEAQGKISAAETAAAQTRAEVAKAAEAYDKLQKVAKEEEEKRIKALSLLRALRQKLVKNESEKEETDKEMNRLREVEKLAQDTLKSDRSRFDAEIVALRAAQEQQITKLRQSFERESASLKQQYEREATAKKGQFELDAITTKAERTKELAAKDARIKQLEATVKEASQARDSLFDQLQAKQAEVESTASQQESLKSKTSELEYELSETKDRLAALQDEHDEVRRHRTDASRDEGNTRRLLAEAESRHDAKVRDLEARARQLEKDRRETEDEMGRNLQERLKEVERLRAALAKKDLEYAESVQGSQKREMKIEEAEKARSELEKRLKKVEGLLETIKEDAARSQQAEAAVREELSDRMQRASELEARLEEVQSRESTLRSNNKTLREELRKLQAGVLLSEKQRHPGVGYFSSFSSSQPNPSTSSSSAPPLPRSGSTTSLASNATSSTIGGGQISPPSSGVSTGVARAGGSGDEALNFEYLRNVILQFLEKPEMRPHLIQVLGVILHFTPSESRRLVAKAGVQQ
ncbi:hypothetical protein JCM11251_004331 [Rhodosporidiobolus azoricus]